MFSSRKWRRNVDQRRHAKIWQAAISQKKGFCFPWLKVIKRKTTTCVQSDGSRLGAFLLRVCGFSLLVCMFLPCLRGFSQEPCFPAQSEGELASLQGPRGRVRAHVEGCQFPRCHAVNCRRVQGLASSSPQNRWDGLQHLHGLHCGQAAKGKRN